MRISTVRNARNAAVISTAGSGTVHQAILALGRQDVDPDGLQPPEGIRILGMSSDHLVVDLGDHTVGVGDEIDFGVGYGALVRAMTSPFVTKIEHLGRSVAPEATQVAAVEALSGVLGL